MALKKWGKNIGAGGARHGPQARLGAIAYQYRINLDHTQSTKDNPSLHPMLGALPAQGQPKRKRPATPGGPAGKCRWFLAP
ncbi:MAG: hypothetical protein EBR73_08360 [Rhodobacteraceae bacterium]|nr:hypothetical protein [Paracoccaceae bacterium]